MPQLLNTTSGPIKIPGAYVGYTVNFSQQGLATNGILALVGEADAGPAFSEESDLDSNSFGPDQLSDVLAKYKSGNLVEAFRNGVNPSLDAEIPGSPLRFKLVKTNASGKAYLAIQNISSTTYGTLYDAVGGYLGNSLAVATVDNVPEAPPTFTGAWAAPQTASAATVRVNGATTTAFYAASMAGFTTSVGVNLLPPAVVSGLVVSGLSVTGGTTRTVVTGAVTAASVSGNDATFTITTGNFGTAAVGDTLVFKTTALNAVFTGFWVVTAVTSNTSIAATRVSGTGAVAGAGPTSLTAGTDFDIYAPITVTHNATTLDGHGKSFEITVTSGSGSLFFSSAAASLGVVGTTASPVLVTSAAERQTTTTITRASDNTNYPITAGGNIGLTIGYLGTDCTMVITATTLSCTVSGGSGANFTKLLSDHNTIADLATWINQNQTGFRAAGYGAKTNALPSTLDQGTWHIATSGTLSTDVTKPGVLPGRIKTDAYDYFTAVSASGIVTLGVPTAPARATSGLPKVATGKNFGTGSKGSTTQANFQAAIDALRYVDCNFVVPLFSRDATSDITDGLTDPASTYTIASVNSYTLSHCNAMSTLQERKNRQCFLSNKGTLTAAKNASLALNAPRAALSFQDVNGSGANGNTWYAGWMMAVKAASMQAAGFYKAIFNKKINVSGILQVAADFNDKSRSQCENLLDAGLLFARNRGADGIKFVSDQTTYASDANPIWNSIQAIYCADVCGLTMADRMEKAYVGKSLADINAGIALASIDIICRDLKSLKLIAASDGAPLGYKDAKVKIVGPSMFVEVTLFLATALYFVTIQFQINQITQTAGA